ALGRRVNEGLAECGIPLCRGGIMAGTPRCCLSIREWELKFAEWIDKGIPEALLNATIFFDFRGQYGTMALAEELRAWLSRYVEGNSRFLVQMAHNALANQPPLGRLRDFVPTGGREHPNAIDLKVNGVVPFIDAARIMSLRSG